MGQAAQIAHAVSEVLPDVTPQWIEERINAAGGESTALFSLRSRDMDTVRARLQSIDGLSMREESRLLSNSRELSIPLDQGLSDYWMEALDKGAGWSLRAVSEQGEEILGSAAPEHIVRITTTLDLPMQAAAQRAVDAESKPAAFVAIGSGGDILAVAQNAAASEQGSIALTGLFPPGSTFKTVTTAGALTSGTVGPDDIVDCPGTAEIDGRIIPNDNNFDLGKVPMHTAFAQSCNTTQGFISQSFAPETMRDTALSLGLGVDFDSPGLTTVTGSVPLTSPGAARVEAAIGQGEVLSSPFGLALMEASLANNGTMALPRLITSVDGPGGFEVGALEADHQPAPLPEHTVESLRSMMKETVTTGSAKTLSDIPDLGGKTGTAETGSGGAHGWFTGIAGDVGFASFVENGDSSAPAIAIAGTWLRDDWRWK
ncbi:penicillin-binding transpeptidase domain-containing protein [Corynebacterium flavescens]|uniref:penicillin-binding transpeptidase domain-containing protein n=1 Tax=Corynebacterium flavescens TaxID=28028 RepID=UPI003FD3CDE4